MITALELWPPSVASDLHETWQCGASQKTDFSHHLVYQIYHLFDGAIHSSTPISLQPVNSGLSQPARLTRSSKTFNIAFPVKVPRNSYGKRAFVHAAPTLWNNLLVSIRSSNSLLDFRRQLKTYFFTLAYNI